MRTGWGTGSEVPYAVEGLRMRQEGGEEVGPLQEKAVVFVLVFLFQSRTAAEETALEPEASTVTTCKRCSDEVPAKACRRNR